MKKIIALFVIVAMTLSLAACGGNQTQSGSEIQSAPQNDESTETPESTITSDTTTLETNGKTLVVYFSQPDDEDDSTVVINGETLGNTQYMANIIQQTSGADIFRITPKTPYPTNHKALVDLASEELANAARPAIAQTIENFDGYETVFIGYPNWWGDMPMILYTFFDTYDFSGKTIVPFNTHGGSGFSDTINTINGLEPEAEVLDGHSISRNEIQDAEQEIVDWVTTLGFAK